MEEQKILEAIRAVDEKVTTLLSNITAIMKAQDKKLRTVEKGLETIREKLAK